ncbi:quinate permease [Cutaneotrichosporon oleaginosum]|uniref:Quinate transporter n=1 Tax=Cutaneotrichosporon oleaginosum TaxID=879819 RepID=A0A0J0XYK8_9TREE|nr:quinate permease [Cutaneotrichosporon oleaginosum]KLT46133.1 quinate permease [Cutaneotrichosporon oleaginosum]TXT10143.1 hypothetical protein COLE_04077 [Cutaneotrichosporon oleaginosum]
MVKLTIVEDRPTPKEVYNWRVYFLASMACWASVMIGYDSAFIGSAMALKSFKDEFGLSTKTKAEFNFLSANIVSCYQAGCFFGALSGYFVGFYFGRKWGLFVASLVFIVGSILQTVASGKTGLGIMYAGRIIAGWSVGVASNLTPIYIAEISPPAIRGRLIGIYELGWQIGAVVGFWIGYGVNQHIPYGNVQWIIPFAVQLIPGGMLGLGCLTLKESPRWLASRDRYDSALANLALIRHLPADHVYVQEELYEIKSAIEHDEEKAGRGILAPIKTLFSNRSYMKRLALCVSLFIGQNVTGINAINYYSPTVFASIGVSGTSTSLLTTGVFGLIKFAVALIWLLWLVDRYGRKLLLIIGSAGGAVCMYWIGIYIAVAKPANNPSSNLSGGGISAMVVFYLWTCFYGPTWNGTPWVMGAEVMPTFIRSATQAIIASSNWLFAFLIARFTPQMFTAMGFGVYLFFASLMVVSIPCVYFAVPETSGIPLEHMDELFALSPRTAHTILAERLRAEHHMDGSFADTDAKNPDDGHLEPARSNDGRMV